MFKWGIVFLYTLHPNRFVQLALMLSTFGVNFTDHFWIAAYDALRSAIIEKRVCHIQVSAWRFSRSG